MKKLLVKLLTVVLVISFTNSCNESLIPEQKGIDLELKSANNSKISYIVVVDDLELSTELSQLIGYEKKQIAVRAASARILNRANVLDSEVEHVYGTALQGFSVKIPPGQLEKLENDPAVVRVEEDQIITLIEPTSINPNGDFDAQSETLPWGINRVGGGNTYDRDLEGNKVAWVIDTGIDHDHPDLIVDKSRGAYFVGRGTKSSDDDHGHGTHVAGTIAAIGGNGTGVIGVAAGASVVPVKVLDRSGNGTVSGVVAGVDYVAAEAADGDVANMSLGGGASTTLDNAVMDASDQDNKKIYFSLAAGNESDDANNHSPARATGQYIYTISAMDINDKFASFSNYKNPPVDYCEPGVSIYSTYKDGGYATASGTSMAAPHMAGILLWGDPVTSSFVKDDPDGNPDPIGEVGGGGGSSNTAPVASAAGPYSGDEDSAITFDASGSKDDDGDALTYTWDFGDGNTVTTSNTSVTHSYSWGDNFTVIVTVSDGKGGSDSNTTTAEVNEINDKPVANPGGPYSGTTGQITFDASGSSDYDNEDGTSSNDQTLRYTWDFGDGTVSTAYSTSFTHTYNSAGEYTVKLVVDDGTVNSDPATTTASISDEATNQPPSVVFDLRKTSNPARARAAVDWTASDQEGNLVSITSELYDDSDFTNLIDSETSSISGSTVSGTHELGLKGGLGKTYYVKVTVSDGVNETTVEDSIVL